MDWTVVPGVDSPPPPPPAVPDGEGIPPPVVDVMPERWSLAMKLLKMMHILPTLPPLLLS